MMENRPFSENILTRRALDVLRSALPSSWSVERRSEDPSLSDGGFDALITIKAPDARTAQVIVELKPHLDPRGAEQLGFRLGRRETPVLVVAPWMSAATQARLQSAGLNLLDLTGNISLQLSDPGLFIRTIGAEHDPSPPEHTTSLKGDRAAAVVRALCRTPAPIGVRALADLAGASPGYTSRLLEMLDQQAALRRDDRGRVTEVNTQRLLERWAEDAPLRTRAGMSSWIDPRGTSTFLGRLSVTKARYAITSSLAAARRAPVAPARSISVYVDDPEDFARQHDLRPAEAGGNVVLLEPRDSAVFLDTWQDEGLVYASLPVVVIDLLSGPGRGPAEAAALLTWMAEHPEVWRG